EDEAGEGEGAKRGAHECLLGESQTGAGTDCSTHLSRRGPLGSAVSHGPLNQPGVVSLERCVVRRRSMWLIPSWAIGVAIIVIAASIPKTVRLLLQSRANRAPPSEQALG